MSNKNVHRLIAYLLITLPFFFIVWKFKNHPFKLGELMPKQLFTITYEFDLSTMQDSTFVKAYLPKTNLNQKIGLAKLTGDTLAFNLMETPTGNIGVWKSATEKEVVFQYSFDIANQAIEFELSSDMAFERQFTASIDTFLAPSEHIQSTSPIIDSLAQNLMGVDLLTTLTANFNFVNQITNSSTGVLTDALTTLRRNRASCNGKSRLFVAFCRAQGIPARVVGGIILENTIERVGDIPLIWGKVQSHQKLAIKPANGSGGGGILIWKKKKGDWMTSGKKISEERIFTHLARIIMGMYSFGATDRVLIEQCIEPHPFFQEIFPIGVPDF